MADFNELRQRYNDARRAERLAGNAALTARERVKQVAARQANLSRRANPDTVDHSEVRERLDAERRRAEEAARERRTAHTDAARDTAAAFASFAELTDPQRAIGQFNDQYPILLLPVRLETRFKTMAMPGAPPQQQLWVRVYPDACSIDTFEPALTVTEVANAQLYWTALWESGGIEDQERAAWRGLVAGHGSGRAEWIATEYQPVNIAARPSKPLATDVILTIPTEMPLLATEQPAVSAFWRAVWIADGDKQKENSARAALDTALGAARATQIVERYRPANLATPSSLPKSQVNVSVSLVVFPPAEDVETRQRSWSRAPTAAVLPDRFVFIGYAGNAAPVIRVGNPIASPLAVGPDPSATGSDQLQPSAGDLKIPEPMRWMVDFDRAVDVGMGFRVDLDELQAARGFDRVLVIGLRVSADEENARAELEELIQHHHFSRSGFSLVPQGTPTNNTEAVSSGVEREDGADASFDDRKTGALFADTFEWLDKRDGQWLAEYLGIDSEALKNIPHSGGRDQLEARAINVALWPATLGYWMETMLAPVFSAGAVDRTRDFFTRYISGCGAVPAIRIGRQPYGILPATAFSRMHWIRRLMETPVGGLPAGEGAFLDRLHAILRAIDEDWVKMAASVSWVGKPGDPHKTLLDIVGLHPSSVEFWQRYAESLEQLFNRLNLQGFGWLFAPAITNALTTAGADLIARLGYTGTQKPDILNRFFFGAHNALKGPIVQDGPLSETERLRAATADGNRNYLEWLIDASTASMDTLYAQSGFADSTPPRALLYLMLRHALQLGYHDVSVRLHLSAGLFDQHAAIAARQDAPFVHVAAQTPVSESRYALLYKPEPAITGNPTRTLGDHIALSMPSLAVARYLQQQVRALERVKHAPTARLERAFVDHIDCCTYRLDAWLLGLVHYQLAAMRNLRDSVDAAPRRGVYLGAYAWLEDVRPEHKELSPVALPPDLAKIFTPQGDSPLTRDSTNQGYIHAPSLNHAVAAAVLRNGYISNASPANRDTMAVNLTSERVRTALGMIEGIREGQSLGALLGYQFERGLHDRHGLAEVDKFIYDIRGEFPLRGNHLQSTRTGPGVSITAVEARNVMDGLALVNHIKATGQNTYPFDRPLPAATAAEATAINAEVDRMLESHDAVADLALAEGVYQAVLGNYDRVASTYDAYSKGNFPPEPQVVRTPSSGLALTHRVALHLDSGVTPIASPVAGIAMTPRAQAEPAINRWLSAVLPPMDQVGCSVTFRDAATNTIVDRQVTLRDLELQPIDLLQLIRGENDQAMSELDDRVVRFTVGAHAPRPDTPVSIRYMEALTTPFTIFEVLPLVRALRSVTTLSRPLRPTDLALTNEAKVGQEAATFVDAQRFLLVRTGLQALRADLTAFQTMLEGPLNDLENRRDEIIAGVDTYVDDLSALLARAATRAVPQTGWGFTYDFKRRAFAAILDQAAALVKRWDERLKTFDAVIDEYDTLPATATDQRKFEILQRAEKLVSTATTDPLPALPDDFKADLLLQRGAFEARRDDFAAVQKTNRTSVTLLLGDVAALTTAQFDFVEFSLVTEEDDIVRFAQDALRLTVVIGKEIDRRLAAAQTFLDQHDASADPAVRVQALQTAAKELLGPDFVIVPEFELSSAQGDELENAVSASQSGSLFDYLVNTVHMDFPLDTWLYGAARVREKLRAWEQIVMFAGALGRPEPDLIATQLPFRLDDRWLALQFPTSAVPDSERLLYTAHFASPFSKGQRQCGLLVDEWAEVIPASEATTGIAFHYDRPNSEPPQTMLLVTPADFRGAWVWDDLVQALNETLDLAKRRAVEPAHIDSTAYARFLPATIMAVTVSQLTISANLALNNNVHLLMSDA